MKRILLFMAGIILLIGAGLFAFDISSKANQGHANASVSVPTTAKPKIDVEDILNDALGKDALSEKQTLAMIGFLQSAQNHGLTPIDTRQFDLVLAQNKRLNDIQEQELITQVLKTANNLNGGRVDWLNVRKDWDMRPKARDFKTEFENAKQNNQIENWLLTLSHDSEAYKGLLAAREKYAQIVKNGGFIHLGASSNNPALLRQRLAQEGYIAANVAAPNEFDAALKAQLAAFQSTHGIENPDGELGERTIAALEVSAQERLKQIDINLERERWTPKGNAPTRIEANIPSQRLVYFENGVPKLQMNTIVGALKTKTPSFATKTRAIVLNPPWHVPRSIKSRFRVQPPGPRNALGRVKFDFDNKFSVFLHDTPNHAPFAARNRALSHGCVRLDKPKDLAQILLAPEGLSREDIDKITTTRTTHYYKLRTQTPVLLLYRTAFMGKDNLNRDMVHFVSDVYEWDNLLANALLPNQNQMSKTKDAAIEPNQNTNHKPDENIALAAP